MLNFKETAGREVNRVVYNNRIVQAQHLLKEQKINALIVTSPSNFVYFSGSFLDSNERLQAIVISQTGKPAMLIHEMSKEEIKHLDFFENHYWKDGENPLQLLDRQLPASGTVAVDNYWPSQYLLELMEVSHNRLFVKSTSIIDALRLQKDNAEIMLLKSSAQIADEVMKQVIRDIRPGMTELDVADHITSLFSSMGVNRLSFTPIVAAGKNGAIPHHQPDETKILSGDVVVIDIGGVKDHYCSDMTRTILLGNNLDQEVNKVYEIVQRAQEEAIKAVKPGVSLCEIDKIARNIICNAGYGPNFTHRTGHGLGIDLHEAPFVTHNNEQLLKKGMVISIEPGVYVQGKFGVRIEDIVVVTSTGCEILNQFTRKLITKNDKCIENN